MTPAKVLLTGASGTVGRRLLPALTKDFRFEVRVLVHEKAVPSAHVLYRGNLGDGSGLEAAATGADAILHLGGVTHARRASRYRVVNAEGTHRLVAAARRGGVRRFVLVSTRAIDARGGAYSRSKLEAERVVRDARRDAVIVRLPELYGAGGAEGLDDILRRARRGAPIPVVGSGTQEIRPAFVEDVIAPLVKALESPTARGKTYTLAGDATTVARFAHACIAAFESSSRVVRLPLAAVAGAGHAARVLPLPIYPDQLPRLLSPKPGPSPEAEHDLGFAPRPVDEVLRAQS